MVSLETLASSCRLTLEMIHENIEDLLDTPLEQLINAEPSSIRIGFNKKVKIVFKDEMKELLGQLRGYQANLVELLSTLQR
jgi:hypothetical protein